MHEGAAREESGKRKGKPAVVTAAIVRLKAGTQTRRDKHILELRGGGEV